MARFQLKWGSTDITADVTSYKRTSAMCEGTKNLSIELVDTGRGIGTWDTLTLWEDGNKVGIFYVIDITDKFDGSLTINSQDSSLRLQRNFEDRIWHPGWLSNAKYWISLWLDRAGVSYNFTVAGNGSVINKDVTFGNDNTWNLIVPLLQQSGWYMMFDENNILQIGELDVDTGSVSESFDETDIIEIAYNKSDKNSRNRVVVWGGRDLATDTWITGTAEANAGWQIDTGDDRTVVVSSNAIKNYASAYSIANRLLNDVIALSKEKILVLTGLRNRTVGDYVYVTSRVYNGSGLITDISVTADKVGGYTTELTLDRLCPRIFAYFAWDGYVYAGTRGGGIYRKPLESSVWSSYNSGLTNLNIKDLYIQNGVFVCVAGDGYAYRSTIALSYWIKISPGQFTDSEDNIFEEEEIIARACTIDDTGTLIIGYTEPDSGKSWMVHYNPSSGITRKVQIIIDGETNFPIKDIDTNGEITVIASEGQGLVSVEEIYIDGLTTCKNVWSEAGGTPFDRRPVAKPSINNYNTTITMDEGTTLVGQSVVFDGVYSYYGSSGTTYRFSGCTRYNIDTSTTEEVQLPVANDCYYSTVSLIDEDTAICVVQEENVGIRIFSVYFPTDTATALGTIGTFASPPIQTHSFGNGQVLIVYTDGSKTYIALCTASSLSSTQEALSASFTAMQGYTGGRLTPYELSGNKVALIGLDSEETLVGCTVSSSGTISTEDSINIATSPSYFVVYQFCPKSDYSSLYILGRYHISGGGDYTKVYEFSSNGEFTEFYSSSGWTNPKLSSWKEGTYLIETDNVTATVTVLEGSGYGSITSTIQENDRISPRADDYDGAFIIFDRSEAELQRHRGTDATVLKTGVDDTGYIWLAGSSILTESQRLYASLSGTILISGSPGNIIRDTYDEYVDVSGTFVTVLEGIIGQPRVEISRATPVMVYTEPNEDYIFSNFSIRNAVDINDWNYLGPAYRELTSDGRVYFKEENDGSFSNFYFASVGNSENKILSFNPELASAPEVIYSGAVVLSGSETLHKIETSNGTDPYFFISTSGTPTSASRFFQKNANYDTFIEYSTGLPENNITIIRVDDRIS